MLYLNKKGDMQYNVITSLLLILVAFVVIFLLQSQLFAEITGNESDIICKTSIEAAARSKNLPTLGGTGIPTVRLDCPSKELIIQKSDVVEGDRIDQEKANTIIADAMLSCWKKVGAGKIDPFSNWDNEKKSYCLLCDNIVFDEELVNFIKSAKDDNERLEKRSIKGLTDFLIMRSPKAGQKSYYEQLYGITQLVSDKKENNIIVPGSVILVQMHKLESKSGETYTYGLIFGGALVVIGIGGAFFTGGASLVGAAAILGYGTVAGVGAYDLFSVAETAFSECKECNAIGGVALLPAEASFQEKIVINDKQGKELYKSNRCDIMVNQ